MTPRAYADLWLWLATGLVAAVAGLRFHGHYFIQVLPAACVLAAPLAAQLGGRARRVLVAAVTAPTALALAPPSRARSAISTRGRRSCGTSPRTHGRPTP